MISIKLFLACLVAGGAALFAIESIWYILEKKLDLTAKLPAEMVEAMGSGYFLSRLVSQFAFLVALPAVIYSWAYVLIPFYGVRAGMVLALYLFIMGIIPFSSVFLMRIKLPLAYTLFQLAGYLVKLIVIYGIIAYLYIL
ncbi:MAG: hypothetical protein PHR28_13470 [candidate division Zixibacteria bacterium]|nr:hypothetical protein [candidate division Zixibacteria bacterium]